MTELLAAVIGAAFGSAFTYAGTWLQQNRDRERARRSLATVLLSEVRGADVTLRGIHLEPTGGVLPPGTFDLLTSPPAEAMASFSPETVQQLLSFGGYLRSGMHVLELIRTGPAKDVRWHAGVLTAIVEIAVHSVPALKQSLEREGGTWIPLKVPSIPAVNPENPHPARLPPSPFDD